MYADTGQIKAKVTINLKNPFALLNILYNNYNTVRQILVLFIRNYLKFLTIRQGIVNINCKYTQILYPLLLLYPDIRPALSSLLILKKAIWIMGKIRGQASQLHIFFFYFYFTFYEFVKPDPDVLPNKEPLLMLNN
jgi:hypothetical protein